MIQAYPQHEVLVMPEDIKNKFRPYYDQLMKLKELAEIETYKDLSDIADISDKAIGMILNGQR